MAFSSLKGFDLSPSLTRFRDQQIQTDVVFDLNGTRLWAHKLIVGAASDYFNALFFSPGFQSPGVVVPVGGVSPEVFRMYLDYVYGNRVPLPDWRMAAQLFQFMDYSQTHWPTKEQDLLNLEIPPEDYIDYLHMLIGLYHGDVPLEVLQKSAKFIKEYVDLSGLEPEVIREITNSPDFDPQLPDRQHIYQNLVSKGYNYREIAGLEERLTSDIRSALLRHQPLTLEIIREPREMVSLPGPGQPPVLPGLGHRSQPQLYGAEARGQAKNQPPGGLAIRFRHLEPAYADQVRLVFGSPPTDLHKGDVITITDYQVPGTYAFRGTQINVLKYSKG